MEILNGQLKYLFSETRHGFFIESAIGLVDDEKVSKTLWLERDLNWTSLLVDPSEYN